MLLQANIGVIDANPSSTAGVIDIMCHLNHFVPRHGDAVRVIATHGDCLAVERMVDAKRARASDMTALFRLEGLEPVPQEFHHRGLMLQVTKQLATWFYTVLRNYNYVAARRHIFVCFMAKSAFWRGFSALAPYTGVGPI